MYLSLWVIDEWEKFNKTSLPGKKKLYSNLNMKDAIDADYMHAKRVWKDSENKQFSWMP